MLILATAIAAITSVLAPVVWIPVAVGDVGLHGHEGTLGHPLADDPRAHRDPLAIAFPLVVTWAVANEQEVFYDGAWHEVH